MIAKVVILCAALAATSASLINTGSSVSSRVMDGHGNYAFDYGIASAGAKRSRSEVGSGYAGPVKTSYTVADSHIAPAAPVAYGHAGLGYGIGPGLGYGAGLGYAGHGLGYAGYGLGYAGHGVGYAGHGLGYGGVIAGPALGLGYGGHGLGYGYGAGKLLL